jgi:hypothetical protein
MKNTNYNNFLNFDDLTSNCNWAKVRSSQVIFNNFNLNDAAIAMIEELEQILVFFTFN